MSAAGMTTAPIAEGLFTWPGDEPRLIGGRCAACGAVGFPRPPSCARCTSTEVEEHRLSRTGTLWSWTVQRFQPKEPYLGPAPFEPYGVGYVDLGSEVLVESRLTTSDPAELEVGIPVELVVVPFATAPDGTTLLTFAFRPAVGEVRPS